MSFFISLEPCRHCGEPVDPAPLDYAGHDNSYSMHGSCARCGGKVFFAFLTYGNPLKGPYTWDTLGQGTSEIIPPRKFIAELQRIVPHLVAAPGSLGVRAWRQNRDLFTRALVCLNELTKFLPEGAAEIPATSAEESAFRARQPDTYQRDWIEHMQQTLQRIGDAISDDLPRIDALAEQQQKAAPKGSVDYLDRDALVAHEQWVDRGRRGKGQLVLFAAEHEDYKIGRGVELSYAKLLESRLPAAFLADAKLVGAEIKNTSLERADLYGAIFHKAQLDSSSLAHANLQLAEFHDATLRDVDLSGANLDQSEWNGAVATSCKLAEAALLNANLDGATFRDCDLRGADLAPADPDPPPTTRGARFESCDLRNTQWQGRDLAGAVFVRCKLFGITGTPASFTGIQIDQADMSAAGDGSTVASADDVLAIWGAHALKQN